MPLGGRGPRGSACRLDVPAVTTRIVAGIRTRLRAGLTDQGPGRAGARGGAGAGARVPGPALHTTPLARWTGLSRCRNGGGRAVVRGDHLSTAAVRRVVLLDAQRCALHAAVRSRGAVLVLLPRSSDGPVAVGVVAAGTGTIPCPKGRGDGSAPFAGPGILPALGGLDGPLLFSGRV